MTSNLQMTPIEQDDDEETLPMIAALAALEFDEAIRGSRPSFAAVTKLREHLLRALGQARSVEEFDVSAVAMIGRALEGQGVRRSRSISEIVSEARTIATSLNMPTVEKLRSDQNEKRFLDLRDRRAFCVALSQSLLAHREIDTDGDNDTFTQ